jgi:hypothetical protein
MKPNQLSNFSYNRKQFTRFNFKDNQYWMEKFKNNQQIQFVCNVQKHNLSFYDLMKLAINLEHGNPRWSCADYDQYVKAQFNSNQKHIYFHDYRIATLNKEIKSIQIQDSHNHLPISFDFFSQNNRLTQLLDNNESMIELTCVKNNKEQFVAFGFLYLFIKRNHMTDYNIFLPITISNSGIELGYLMSLCSHDYNIAIKNHYEKMMNLTHCTDFWDVKRYSNHSNPNDKHGLFKLKSKLDWLHNDLCCLQNQFRENFEKENQHLLSTYKAKPSDNQSEIVARVCFKKGFYIYCFTIPYHVK